MSDLRLIFNRWLNETKNLPTPECPVSSRELYHEFRAYVRERLEMKNNHAASYVITERRFKGLLTDNGWPVMSLHGQSKCLHPDYAMRLIRR